MTRMRAVAMLPTVVAVLTAIAPAVARAGDEIALVSVSPTGAVTRGVETEFTFEIDVTLDGTDEAVVHLGFNTEEPGTFRMLKTERIYRGMQRLTMSAVVVPVDWGRKGRFAALINIGPKEAGSYRPTSSVTHPIEVVP